MAHVQPLRQTYWLAVTRGISYTAGRVALPRAQNLVGAAESQADPTKVKSMNPHLHAPSMLASSTPKKPIHIAKGATESHDPPKTSTK